MDRSLPPLPYAKDALEPHMTGLTLELHHGRHHAGYLKKLTKLVEGRPEASHSVETLVRNADDGQLFDLAAQAWNHAFFWRSLRPPGGPGPGRALLAAIDRSFGSLDGLKGRLVEAATGHFGSGWVWLVADGPRLRVESTHDAMNPLRRGAPPLLTLDVWEHAYYLDYFDGRERYAAAVVQHLLDWEFAAENLERAKDARDELRDAAPRRTSHSEFRQEERR
jgi:Fe-Mn family superoxide dismutase